jgi:Protein of unknown function (DUF2782)
MYRILLVLAWWGMATPAFAFLEPPKALEHLPDLPLSSARQPGSSLEPEVSISGRDRPTVGESRERIKVTPKSGKPYYLEDIRGDGHFTPNDTLDEGLLVPRWKIFEFGRNS